MWVVAVFQEKETKGENRKRDRDVLDKSPRQKQKASDKLKSADEIRPDLWLGKSSFLPEFLLRVAIGEKRVPTPAQENKSKHHAHERDDRELKGQEFREGVQHEAMVPFVATMTKCKKENDRQILLILDNIRSAHNVGSIFRTADATGVDKLYLCGYTPAPIDRFGRENTKLTKASLGAEGTVSWKKRDNIHEVLEELSSEGVLTLALEQSPQASDYRSVALGSSTAVVLGNEVEGVSGAALAYCHDIVEIPMFGKKESLNVAVTAGVVLYQFLETNK